MSEALEVRKAPVARSLRLPGPAAPLVRQRPAMPGEIPDAATSFLRGALGSQWIAQAFYALGWRMDSGGRLTGALRASVLVRARRGDERVIALWETPWPVPAGLEPPGMDVVPELASHLPRGDVIARAAEVRARRLPLLGTNDTVKWAYGLGAYWIRPAPPLAREDGRTAWWAATELKRAVTSPPP